MFVYSPPQVHLEMEALSLELNLTFPLIRVGEPMHTVPKKNLKHSIKNMSMS